MIRKVVVVNLLVWLVSVISTVSVVATVDGAQNKGDSFDNQKPGDHRIRGGHQRRMPGYETMDFGDFDNAEVGFAAGIIFALLLVCFLLCICCGGGSRCSLWDCLALLCIWEICCDGRNPTDFVLV